MADPDPGPADAAVCRAFFLAGAVLIALTYLYLGQALDRQLTTRIGGADDHIAAFVRGSDAHTSARPAQLQDALRAQFEQDRNDTLPTMLIWSLASLGAAGLGAVGLGWLLAGRALRPLQQITATARRVADRSLHERIALDGPDDEIKDLADTFDAMLERLDRSFDGQRRFVANASHELRTPLTINRTLIEVALDTPNVPESTHQLGATLLQVNHRHERLIDGLLVLASSDQRLTEHTPVDLADIARHAATSADDAAREAGVEVRTTLAAAPVVGDPLLLERLIQNLLDNAIRYNISEHGRVSISTGTTGGYACLTVDNTGPVVPGYEVDGLFEPFRRLTSADRLAYSGPPSQGRRAGLGLSIVRSVAHAHGGDVQAPPGRTTGSPSMSGFPARRTRLARTRARSPTEPPPERHGRSKSRTQSPSDLRDLERTGSRLGVAGVVAAEIAPCCCSPLPASCVQVPAAGPVLLAYGYGSRARSTAHRHRRLRHRLAPADRRRCHGLARPEPPHR